MKSSSFICALTMRLLACSTSYDPSPIYHIKITGSLIPLEK